MGRFHKSILRFVDKSGVVRKMLKQSASGILASLPGIVRREA